MKLLKISHSLCFQRMDNKYHSGHSKMLGQSADEWWAYWHSSAGQSTKREAVLKGGILLVSWYSPRIYENHMAPILINPVQWQNSVRYNSCELKNTNFLLQTTWLPTVEPWVALIWEKTGCQENMSSKLHYFWDLNSRNLDIHTDIDDTDTDKNISKARIIYAWLCLYIGVTENHNYACTVGENWHGNSGALPIFYFQKLIAQSEINMKIKITNINSSNPHWNLKETQP